MRDFSGLAAVDGDESPAGPEGRAPGGHEFAHLGGMDLLSASPLRRRARRVIPWFLGIGLIALIVRLLFFPFAPRSFQISHGLAAIQSIRAIQLAEEQYQSTYPANGYTCDLKALGGDANSGPPTPTSAQILQGDITTGFKSGYIIAISNCKKVAVNGADRITGFMITAVPRRVGETGKFGYCADPSGPVRFDPAGGTNCTQDVQ